MLTSIFFTCSCKFNWISYLTNLHRIAHDLYGYLNRIAHGVRVAEESKKHAEQKVNYDAY